MLPLMCSWPSGCEGQRLVWDLQAHHPLPRQVPQGFARPSPGCRFLAPTNKGKLGVLPAQPPWWCPGEADPLGLAGGACGHEPWPKEPAPVTGKRSRQ